LEQVRVESFTAVDLLKQKIEQLMKENAELRKKQSDFTNAQVEELVKKNQVLYDDNQKLTEALASMHSPAYV
jgi:FtsZ-binding cell division protein ZapB